MTISSSLHDRLLAEAARDPGREVCGLLFGTAGAILDIRPAANVAAEPARAFEIDPATLFAAHRAERAGGVAAIGHYHSHPNGSARPSPCDAAVAHEPGRLWLIVAGGDAALWRAMPGGSVEGAFEPVALDVREG